MDVYDESRRADPTNGIALNALYDKAFDRGFIAFDEDFRLVLSSQLRVKVADEAIKEYFIKFEGKKLEMPYRFVPEKKSILFHKNIQFIE